MCVLSTGRRGHDRLRTAHLPGAVAWDPTTQLADHHRRPDLRGDGIGLPEPTYALRASHDDILPRLGLDVFSLVDVRSPADYEGEVIAPPDMRGTARRAGHIPGAASIPWSHTIREDGRGKSVEELRELYGSEGVTPDQEVIAFCRIGERSRHTWVVLHDLLGAPRVRNHDGLCHPTAGVSRARAHRPVSTGTHRRPRGPSSRSRPA